MKAKRLAQRAASIVTEKLGEDVVILDLRKRSPLADYFVVASASSTVHAQAIAEEIVSVLKSEGQRVHHSEGTENGLWILLDYFDVVVHIFSGDVRQFYGLERLWGDAPRRDFAETDEA
jgi:ribosome-associated protein